MFKTHFDAVGRGSVAREVVVAFLRHSAYSQRAGASDGGAQSRGVAVGSHDYGVTKFLSNMNQLLQSARLVAIIVCDKNQRAFLGHKVGLVCWNSNIIRN